VGVGEAALQDPSAPAFYKEKAARASANGLKVRKWAKQYGVKVAVGNDTNHCRMDMEAEALIEAGWSPMEALQALTIRGAEVCGLEDRVGTLEVGKLADVIAINGDPLASTDVLRSVPFVMKAGKVEFSEATRA
jgi:imidazolonepropionase-like amidohydrolase